MKEKKYIVRFLFDVFGWAYYWRCLALQKNAPEDFDVSIGSNYGAALKEKSHDLILQLAYSYAKDVRRCLSKYKYKTLLVSSYNVGWGYANNWLPGVIKESDYVIINNKEMWDKSGRHPKTINISNGVDTSIFSIKKPFELRKPRVLWIGSYAHRRTKNYDRLLIPLLKMCQQEKIVCDFRLVDSCGKNRMNQDQMATWYNTGTIYVVASSTEGTPNPALEAASCGCIVVSTKVGNMPELIENGRNGYLCEANTISLMNGIRCSMKNSKYLSNNMQQTIKGWDWKERSKQYYDFFRKIIDARRQKK